MTIPTAFAVLWFGDWEAKDANGAGREGASRLHNEPDAGPGARGATGGDRAEPAGLPVYEGNTADAKTLLPQVKRLRDDFGIDTLVIVGDRGMISQKAIGELRGLEGVAWITALKSAQIRLLRNQGNLQLGLFDQRNLIELTHPDFPGERLVTCRNPQLAALRAHKRQELLQATVAELDQVQAMVGRKRLRGTDQIGVRVGRVVNKNKVAKHFELTIQDRLADQAQAHGGHAHARGRPPTRRSGGDRRRLPRR